MPIDAKPLFRPDVLRSHLAGFELPAHVDQLRPKLKHWADLLASGIAAEVLILKNEIGNLVNEAYGLTPEEVALMWQTAPPRMPVAAPQAIGASRQDSQTCEPGGQSFFGPTRRRPPTRFRPSDGR